MLSQHRMEILRVLAAKKTMTAAAAELYMSTSAVSQQLALLEQEVGVPLLIRTGRRVRLTDAGIVLAKYADEMAALTETAVASMRRFSGSYAGTVRLSAFPSLCSAVVPAVLAELGTRYPELSVQVSDLEPYESVGALRSGAADLSVIDNLNQFPLKGLRTSPVTTDELVLCVPVGTPGLPPGAVDLDRFRDARWCLDGSQEVFDEFLHKLCRQHGFTPNIVARCRNISVTLSLIEAGIGVALLSRMHVRKDAFNILTRSLSPACVREVIIARREATASSHLVDAVETVLAEHVTRYATAQ